MNNKKLVALLLLAVMVLSVGLVVSTRLTIVGGYDLNVTLTKVVIDNKAGGVKTFEAHGSSFSFDSGTPDDKFQNIHVSLTLPANAEKKVEKELTEPNGTKVKVYVWEVEMSLAIKADPDWAYVFADLYDNPNVVTVYFTVESRYKYSLLSAYAYNVTRYWVEPYVLAARHNWAWWQTLLDGGADTYPLTPLQGGDVPNTVNKPYPDTVEEAYDALELPVTLWVKGSVGGTLVRDNMIAGGHDDAPSTLVFKIKLEISAIAPVDPTTAENRDMIKDELNLPPPPNEWPWWAVFIVLLIAGIALLIILIMIAKALLL